MLSKYIIIVQDYAILLATIHRRLSRNNNRWERHSIANAKILSVDDENEKHS